jgi:hypothetical protein
MDMKTFAEIQFADAEFKVDIVDNNGDNIESFRLPDATHYANTHPDAGVAAWLSEAAIEAKPLLRDVDYVLRGDFKVDGDSARAELK